MICLGEGDWDLGPPEDGGGSGFDGHDLPQHKLLGVFGGQATEDDVDRAVGILEGVVLVFIIVFFLALEVLRILWLWNIFEGSAKLVALRSGVLPLWVPWVGVFEQLLEGRGVEVLLRFAL